VSRISGADILLVKYRVVMWSRKFFADWHARVSWRVLDGVGVGVLDLALELLLAMAAAGWRARDEGVPRQAREPGNAGMTGTTCCQLAPCRLGRQVACMHPAKSRSTCIPGHVASGLFLCGTQANQEQHAFSTFLRLVWVKLGHSIPGHPGN